MVEQEISFTVCYSRCLYCGRKTVHEVCHECEAKLNEPGRPITMKDFDWTRFYDKDTDLCADPDCELWNGEPPDWVKSGLTPDEEHAIWAWKMKDAAG